MDDLTGLWYKVRKERIKRDDEGTDLFGYEGVFGLFLGK